MKLKSSEPFWLVKNGLIQSYPSLQENIKTEIVIVGAGITGSLIAHQCIKDGFKTVMIDRREVANGSTSATTSMLQYEIDVQLHELKRKIGDKGAVAAYKACHDSIDTLEKICTEIKSDCGFKKKKSLYYAALKKDVATLQEELEARCDAGFKVKWMKADEIENTFNIYSTHGGILSEQGGSMDAFRLAHDLLIYNTKKGLKIFDKTEIKTIKYGNKKVKITTENDCTIEAKKIIYCNGFESVQIIKEKFVNLLSTYAVVSEQNNDDLKPLTNLLVWNTADPYIYLRTTDDNRFLIGGEDEEFVDNKKRDALIYQKEKKLTEKFMKLFPDKKFTPDFSWAGTFGETKDGLPYIGKHRDFPGAYFVLGFGGNGITFSVIGMEMVSSMLSSKKHPLENYFRFGR